MAAAGMAPVPARIRFGRGGALAAVAMFLAVRVVLTVLVTPVLGRRLGVVGTLLHPLPSGDIPGASAEVELEDAAFLNVTAWQGSEWGEDQPAFLDPLERVKQGVYRTTRPIPVHDGWKALLRLHRDAAIVAVPIFMPEDPAIPAEQIPAEASFTRGFEPDRALLLREARDLPTTSDRRAGRPGRTGSPMEPAGSVPPGRASDNERPWRSRA